MRQALSPSSVATVCSELRVGVRWTGVVKIACAVSLHEFAFSTLYTEGSVLAASASK